MSKQKGKSKELIETPKPKHTIFGGAIAYDSPADFDKFLEIMDKNQALQMLVTAVSYSQTRGVFNLEEASLLAKAIKTFVVKPDQPIPEQPNQE